MNSRMPSGEYVQRLSRHALVDRISGKRALNTLDLELTERCNNRCAHCHICLPQDDTFAIHNELNLEQLKEILKEASELGCKTINITGGEPLLRPEFEEIYIFARELNMTVSLLTNATLISCRLALLFAKVPPLENIEVTVYGMTKDTYEAITGSPETYEAAWNGINNLMECNVPFIVRAPFLLPMVREVQLFEQWANIVPSMNGQPPSFSMYFSMRSRRNSDIRNRRIRSQRPSLAEYISFSHKRKYRVLEQLRFCKNHLRISGKLFNCEAGLHNGCIDPYGYYHLCVLLKHPKLAYNVLEGSLHHALETFAPRIREKEPESLNYISRCAKCFLRPLCGQCPAKSWTENGTLDEPVEYLCDIAHSEAVNLGILYKGEKAWNIVDWTSRVMGLSSRKEPEI